MDIKIALGKIEQYWQIIRNLHFHIEQEGKISPEEYALIEKYLKVISQKYKDLIEEEQQNLTTPPVVEPIVQAPPVQREVQNISAPIQRDVQNIAPAPVVQEYAPAPVAPVQEEIIVPPVSVVEEKKMEEVQIPTAAQPVYDEVKEEVLTPVIENIAPEIVAEAPKSNSISSYLEQMLDNPDKVPAKPLLFSQDVAEKKTPSLNDKLKEMKSPVEDLNSRIKKATAEKISLNDKFEFIRELFGHNSIEYANAIQIFDTEGAQAWDKVESLFSERFNWNARPGSVEKLKRLVMSK